MPLLELRRYLVAMRHASGHVIEVEVTTGLGPDHAAYLAEEREGFALSLYTTDLGHATSCPANPPWKETP